MKINFEKVFKTFDGQPIMKGADSKEPITLKWVSIESLIGIYQDEKELQGEEKLKRYKLAMKISNGNIIEISVEEIALIKNLIGKAFGTLIVGQAWEYLEGKDD